MPTLSSRADDLVCIEPPYYRNVQKMSLLMLMSVLPVFLHAPSARLAMRAKPQPPEVLAQRVRRGRTRTRPATSCVYLVPKIRFRKPRFDLGRPLLYRCIIEPAMLFCNTDPRPSTSAHRAQSAREQAAPARLTAKAAPRAEPAMGTVDPVCSALLADIRTRQHLCFVIPALRVPTRKCHLYFWTVMCSINALVSLRLMTAQGGGRRRLYTLSRRHDIWSSGCTVHSMRCGHLQ